MRGACAGRFPAGAPEYCALLFLSAETSEALHRNLAALCDARVLNLEERNENDEQARAAAALAWLSQNPGWILIIDSVDSPEAAKATEDLLAQLDSGHVLVTSRLSDWSGGVQRLELDVLNESDSAAFLLERTSGCRRETTTDASDARTLAQELGNLAVALEQAGAFIAKVRISLVDYLHRWREREERVREWHNERLMKYPRSVPVTWDTTFVQLDAPASALLHLLSWLAPEPIPRALLETEIAKQVLSSGVQLWRASGGIPTGRVAAADMEDAISTLAGFSLLNWQRGNESFRVHRLVQEITRDRLSVECRLHSLQGALHLVNGYLPNDAAPHDVRSWPRWQPMRGHVANIIAAADAAAIVEPTVRLMGGLGILLRMQCVWTEAESFSRRALSIAEQSFGPHDNRVAGLLNELAQVLLTAPSILVSLTALIPWLAFFSLQTAVRKLSHFCGERFL
jgi:hypothetical protein